MQCQFVAIVSLCKFFLDYYHCLQICCVKGLLMDLKYKNYVTQ